MEQHDRRHAEDELTVIRSKQLECVLSILHCYFTFALGVTPILL